MGFSRQEYWNRLSLPTPGDLPDPGTEPMNLVSPALASGFSTTGAIWDSPFKVHQNLNIAKMFLLPSGFCYTIAFWWYELTSETWKILFLLWTFSSLSGFPITWTPPKRNTTIWIELANEEYRSDIIISPVSYNTFPGGLDGKESSCNAGELSTIPGLGRSPGGGHGNPLQYSCLKNHHGQRSLAGYSPWGSRIGQDWATKHKILLAHLW